MGDTPTAGGTTTSFSNTPQAKDDLFLATATGLNEDSASVVLLDVMANDLGGNAKTLFSIDNGVSSGTVVQGDLLTQDLGRAESTSSDYSLNGAHIWITSGGQVGYDTRTLSAAFRAQLQALNSGQFLTDTFTYAIRLGNGTLSWATATVQFAGANDAPTVVGVVTGNAIEDGVTSTLNALANASDVDSSTTLTVVNVPASLPAGVTYNAATHSFTLDPSNAAYQHLAAGQTTTVTVSYGVSDGTATTPDSVKWTITGSNDAPVAVVDTGTAGENETKSFNVLANDTDVDDGHSFTLVSASAPAGKGTASVVGNQVQFNSGTAFDHLAQGTTETVVINYSMKDEFGATSSSTLTLTITGTNDGPVAVVDTAAGTENQTLTVDVLANDTDVDDGHSFTLVSASAPAGKGTATVVSNQLQFTPGTSFDHLAKDVTETVVVSCTMKDEFGATSSSTLTLTITGTNDGPVAVVDTAAGTENQTLTVDVLANDTDVDDGHSFTLVSASAPAGKGTATVVSNQLQFTPGTSFDHLAKDVTETVVINYTMKDEFGATSSSTLTITVTGTNDAPVVSVEIADQSTDENAAYSYDTATQFSDVDDGDTLSYSASGLPAWASIDAGTGVISGTPDNGDVGSSTITVTATDEDGTTASSTFDLTVDNVNDQPVVSVEIADQSTDEDAPYSYDASANFADDDTIHGDTLSYSASGLPAWASIDAGTGVISGTPDNGDVGSSTITVTATDEDGTTASSTFDLTVDNVNDQPVVSVEIADQSTDEDAPYSYDASANFADDDTIHGDTLSYSASGLPAWASIDAGTGVISGTPDNGDVGSSTITVTATDEDGTTASSTFDLTVDNVNDQPVVSVEIADQSTDEDAPYSYDASANFADDDTIHGDTLSYSASGLPAWASIDAGTGVISGTPDNGDVGSSTITVTATDEDGTTASSTFDLTVDNVNDQPVVSVEIADQSTDEDAPYSYDASANFADDDTIHGDTLSYSASGLPAWASIDAGTGVISGTPDNGDVGSSTITVTATDEDGTTASSTFDLTVDNVNDQPVVSVEIADQSTDEDAPYSYDASANFADDDTIHGDTLSYSASGLPAWASIDAGTGVISGTPDNGDVGSSTITVTATDEDGTTASSTFDLTVDNVNDQPVVSVEIADQSTDEDAPYSYDASANFADDDTIHGDTLSYSASGLPAWASIDAGTGVISGTPDNGDVGSSTITVTATDEDGTTASSTFDLTVDNVNDQPVVSVEIADQSTDEDAPYSYDASANFADDDTIHGDTLSYSASGLPAWASIDAGTGVISGTPDNGDVGSSTITVTATDEDGTTASSTFDLTVDNVNDQPVVSVEIADQSTDEDAPYSYDASANFADDDTIHGDTLSYSASGLPAWASIDAGTGVISGTPDNGDVGSSTITVTATDEDGTTASSTFDLTVDNVNDQPVVSVEIADQSTDEDAPYSYDASANFADDDTIHGDTLSYSASGLPAWASIDAGTGVISGTPDNGDVGSSTITVTATDEDGTTASSTFDLTVDNVNDQPVVSVEIADQSTDEDAPYSYDASANFADDDTIHGDTLSYSASGLPAWASIDAGTGVISGTPDNGDVGSSTITVTATDEDGTTASSTFDLTVDNVNDQPVVSVEIADQSTDEDAPYSYDASANFADDDTIHGDTLSYSASGLPAWASIDAGTGVISGTPDNGDVGSSTITVTATDEDGTTASSTFDLTVDNVNDQPVVSVEIADQSTDEDAPYSYDASANFADDDTIHGDTLSYSASGLPAWASIDAGTGVISGTPDNGDVGSSTITVTATDEDGTTASSTFDLTVDNVNDQPVVSVEIADQSTDEDAPYSYDASANFADDDTIHGDTLSYSASGLPAWASIDAGTGVISGTPDNGDVGSSTITVTATDEDGTTASSTFDLTVDNVNDQPVVSVEIADQSTDEDAPYSYDASANFADDDTIHGDTLSYSASGLPAWASIDAGTGVISGTPDNGDVGSSTITVTATDEDGTTASSTFDLTVDNVNDQPVVSVEIADQSTDEDAPYSYDASANFADDDTIHGDTLSYSASGLPAWASIDAGTGVISGTPDNGDVGSSTITVTATDEDGTTASSTFDLTVDNVNDQPVVSVEIADQSTDEDAPYSYDASANFADDDTIHGDTLSYSASGLPAWASIDAGTGVISGTPDNGDVGSSTITVTATDEDGTTASSTFDLTVDNVNDQPVVSVEIADQSTDEDAPYSYDASANFADDDTIHGDTLSYSASGLPAWASIDAGTGVISGTPDNGDVGSSTITVTATDEDGTTASSTFDLTVDNVNDAPTATNLSAAESYTEDTPLNLIDIVVSDVDSATVTATLTLSNVAAGALSTATSGAVTSTYNATTGVWSASGAKADVNTLLAGVTLNPATDFNGSFTVATSISDGIAAAITGTKVFTGTAVNDAPTATNLSAAESYTEDTPLNLIDIVVSDVDSATVTATLTLSNVAAGALSTATSGAVTSTYNATTGVWSASGAKADVNTLLAGVTLNPATDFNGSFTVATSISDGIAAAITGTKVFTGTAVNDAPTATNLSAAESYTEDTPLNLIDIVVSDVDSATVTATLTLSNVAAGALSTATSGAVTSTYNATTGVWSASGAKADVNTLLAGVTLNPATDFNGSFTVATSISDGIAAAITGTKVFTGTAVNDAPTATNLSAAESYTEDTPLNLIDIVVSDVDSATVTATLTLSNVAAGALSTATSGAVTSTYNATTGVWSASGAKADVNTLLAGVTLNPATDFNGSFTVATSISDGIAAAITGTKVFTGTAVNDAPTATNLSAAESYTEDTPLNLIDIVVSDVDSATVTATLTLSNVAAGALSTATSGAVTSTYNATTGVWSASGAKADVNTLLAGVTLNPATDFNGSFTVATSISDGIAAAITGTKVFTGTAVNDAPTATNLSAAESYTEDTPLNLIDIVVSDVDSATVTATLTLSNVAAGALSTATSGAVTSTYNATTGVWSASGAKADVNTLLAGVTLNPATDFNGSFTVATSISDGIAAAITGTKVFTGTAVNDAPTATNLSAAESYTEDTPLNLIDIVVSDVDSATVTATLTLSNVAAGALSTATSGAVTSTYNATTGVWSASGAKADVNTLLAGVTLNPATNFNGSFTVATSISDGIAAAITGTKVFTGTAVNDAPTATNLSAAESYTEDTPLNLIDIVVSDVDSATVTATLTLSNVAAGALSTATSGAVTSTYNATTGVWSASGAKADVNTLLAGVTLNPATNFNGSFTVATSISDGIAAAITGTKVFTGTAVNDSAVDLIFTYNGTPGNSLPSGVFGQITAVDPDGGGPVTFSLTGLSATTLSGGTATGFLGDLTISNSGQVSANNLDDDRIYEVTFTASQDSNTFSETFSVITGTNNPDTVDGTAAVGDDVIFARGNGDIIFARSGNDTVFGQSGDDQIHGGDGNDVLYGGGNNDSFFFDTALNASTNVDTIKDFDASNTDKIDLDHAIFTQLTLGNLASGSFVSNAGGNALDGNDYILFDTGSGNLYYDADGNGAGTKVLFATIDLTGFSGTLDASDFLII